jgi:hypothetical protein
MARPAIQFIQEKFKGKAISGAEIGVEQGLNAEEIYSTLNIDKLYLVDIWDIYTQQGEQVDISLGKYEIVKEKFSSYPNIIIKKMLSVDAAKDIPDETLDFVYIDGNHDYEFVRDDINAWYPKVKSGGVISGHDFELDAYPGIVKAVNEFIEKYGLKLIYNNYDWWAEKLN